MATKKERSGLLIVCKLAIQGRWRSCSLQVTLSNCSCVNHVFSSRFFIHKSIRRLEQLVQDSYGQGSKHSMLFATPEAASRCKDFILHRGLPAIIDQLSVITLVLDNKTNNSSLLSQLQPTFSATLFPPTCFSIAKEYWQHTGDGISSRQAEFCTELFNSKLLIQDSECNNHANTISSKVSRGPRRYQTEAHVKAAVVKETPGLAGNESNEATQFLEERFGRNLNVAMVKQARGAICHRIANATKCNADTATQDFLAENGRSSNQTPDENVFLFPCGMNAIFNTHRALLHCRGNKKSVSFGFPYVDTLKILQKFGPGCFFYGFASDSDLDELEQLLRGGEQILALFCEFPGNPLLVSPDLKRIRLLADEYCFAVVVDETIGTFANVDVLQFADVVVSSLTKIFSGESNVMGGCAILNAKSNLYQDLKRSMEAIYEHSYWAEDIIFMERNSRDYLKRVVRVNSNAEMICSVLKACPFVKELFYPKFGATKANYDVCRRQNGGYGGLLSVVFKTQAHAEKFYDNMNIAKGPSLGTNFTLCSPYALLAHYNELPWAASYGVDANLVRISVGLEEMEELRRVFERALALL